MFSPVVSDIQQMFPLLLSYRYKPLFQRFGWLSKFCSSAALRFIKLLLCLPLKPFLISKSPIQCQLFADKHMFCIKPRWEKEKKLSFYYRDTKNYTKQQPVIYIKSNFIKFTSNASLKPMVPTHWYTWMPVSSYTQKKAVCPHQEPYDWGQLATGWEEAMTKLGEQLLVFLKAHYMWLGTMPFTSYI